MNMKFNVFYSTFTNVFYSCHVFYTLFNVFFILISTFFLHLWLVYSLYGLTENAGREIGGPSKLQGMKLQDMKLTDQCAGHETAGHENAGHEIAGHEHDGPKMTPGREIRAEKVVLTR